MIKKLRHNAYSLLRWSEQYTKTDMVYLTSGGFWLSLKTFFIALIAFGLSVAFANLLVPTTYGEYKYIFSIFGLLTLPTLMGMGNAISRSVAQGFEGTPLAALQTKIKWGMLGSFASVAIALYYFWQGNNELAGAFALVAVFVPFVDTLGVFNSILTGKQLFKLSASMEIAIQAFAAATIVLTLFLTNNLILILASYFCAYTFARAIALTIVMRRYTTNKSVDPSAITYGKHLSLMETPALVSGALDNILLWQFAGPVSLAMYAFAKGIPTQVSSAVQRIITLAFPRFVVRDYNSIKDTLPHKMWLVFVIMFGIVLAYILAAPYIFALLFPNYIGAVVYSQIFSLTLLFFPQKFIATAFQAHGHTKNLYLINSAIPPARMVLALILIPPFGILGALATELTARTLNLLLITYLYIRS